MELNQIIYNLKEAQAPEDVFGADLTPSYRQLMASVHPDKFLGTNDLRTAQEAFNLVSKWKSAADRKTKAGTYGNRDAPVPEEDKFQAFSMETRAYQIIFTGRLGEGAISDVYQCVSVNKNTGLELNVALKIVREYNDNDLMGNEEKILAKINSPSDDRAKRFQRFMPQILDSFVVREPGSQRKAHVMPLFSEFHTLEEVMEVHPQGIDFRDMVWMFKRVLHGVGWAHEQKVIHGAILPPHVMIHPVNHGAKLIGWSNAVDLSIKKKKASKGFSLFDHVQEGVIVAHPHVKAIDGGYRDFYPPEVFEKEKPTAATDIYMAGKCAKALMGEMDMPPLVQNFFDRCTSTEVSQRPQDAWGAHEELDSILKRVVGKRHYREFPMPYKGL